MKPLTESEVRKLRDIVFIVPISDVSWSGVRANWMRPDSVEWLEQKSAQPLLDCE